MSGFPNLERVLTIELVLGQPYTVGAVANGAPMTCVPLTGGTMRSVEGGVLAGLLDAECVNGLDTSRMDPSGKFTRLAVNSVWKNKDGAMITVVYEALIRLTPEIVAIFMAKPEAKSTEFGSIFATIKFETGDEKLAPLEENQFVASGRMVLSEKGVGVEYNVSRIVA